MSTRRKVGDVVWKTEGAGFVGQGSWAVIIAEDNPDPCMGINGCEDDDCLEWATLWGLPGSTKEEALAALGRGEYLGSAYHVSECEMRDEQGGP